jgi:cyclic beta-1,2-glucan synthetase
MDTEAVVSPYSSFLALAIDPRGVVRNLKKLERYGARGSYGFWEAADFTPARIVGGKPQIVRCAMAHHLGMSMISVTNLLCGGIMQKRFMSEPAMRAHAGLLQEKVPVGGVLLHRRAQEPPEKPKRAAQESWRLSGAGVSVRAPARCLLSNGVYNIIAASNGAARAYSGKIFIYRGIGAGVAAETGVRLHVKTGGALVPLLPGEGACEDAE